MAAGTYSGFQIYPEQFFAGWSETLQQNADAFNDASRGAIRLIPRLERGHYTHASFIDVLSNLVTRRDISSVSTAADMALTSDEEVSVKLNRKIGPVNNTRDGWMKETRGTTLQEYSLMVGQQTASAVATDYLNSAIYSLVGALTDQSGLKWESETGTIDIMDLTHGLQKFGDKQSSILVWLMHSKAYFDLMRSQLSAATMVEVIPGIAIAGGSPASLGRPIIVSDSAALVEVNGISSGVPAYKTLGLAAGAATIVESEERHVVSEEVTGLENLVYRLQGEYAFNVGLRGLKYDVQAGINPTNTTLATTGTWDPAVTSDKLKPGVIISTG